MSRLGSRLRELRHRKGLTLEEAVKSLPIDISTLSAYERGDRTPPIAKLQILAEFYGVPVGELLQLDVSPYTEQRPAKKDQLEELRATRRNLVQELGREGIDPERVQAITERIQEIDREMALLKKQRVGHAKAVPVLKERVEKPVVGSHNAQGWTGVGSDDPVDFVLQRGQVRLLCQTTSFVNEGNVAVVERDGYLSLALAEPGQSLPGLVGVVRAVQMPPPPILVPDASAEELLHRAVGVGIPDTVLGFALQASLAAWLELVRRDSGAGPHPAKG